MKKNQKQSRDLLKKTITQNLENLSDFKSVDLEELLELQDCLLELIATLTESEEKKVLNEEQRKKRYQQDITSLNRCLQFFISLLEKKRNSQ